MRFQRFLAGLFTIVLAVPLVLSSVHAHPGRTDSNGGHTDHDTGKYHYHHGHPAHDHYDMDNNGTTDCPYEFVDKTGQNSGAASSGNPSSSQHRGSSSDSYGNSIVAHKTISRLDLILGINGDKNKSEAPNTVTQQSSTNTQTPSLSEIDWKSIDGLYPSVCILLAAFGCLFTYCFYSSCLSNYKWDMFFYGIGAAVCFYLLRSILATIFLALLLLAFVALTVWALFQIIKSEITNILSAKKVHSKTTPYLPSEHQKTPKPEPKAIPPLPPNPQDSKCVTLHPPLPPMPVEPETNPLPPAPQNTITNPHPITPKLTCDIPDDGFISPDPEVDFRPPPGLNTDVSVHARCRDTCRYLWYETLLIRSRTTPPISSNSCIYIWTALFYTAVKTLRSQDSVNRIYSYFDEVTGDFVTEIQYQQLVIDKVREVYRSIRETLNESDIDPRTENGRRELWHLIVEYIPESNDPRLQAEFEDSAERIWVTVADVFPQAKPHPKTQSEKTKYSVREDELPFDL